VPTRVSKAFGVPHKALVKQGAFDAFIDVDSLLYVDPHLIGQSSQPELSGSVARFEVYFSDVLRLLKASRKPSDLPWKEAWRRLTFREIPYVALGYAKNSTRGRAIGPALARDLTGLSKEIVDAGIEDPELFTLLGLLQEGVGPDLISDMTISIILPDLLAFSERVAKRLKVRMAEINAVGGPFRLPATEDGEPFLLVPADVLRRLPVAYSWDDIDLVASENAALRAKVNRRIGETWRHATRSTEKKELRDAVLKHPELMRDLIEQYRAKEAKGYNFDEDPAAVQLWYEVAEELSAAFPLEVPKRQFSTTEDVYDLVNGICSRFKELVEDNRLSRILYNDNGRARPEKVAQLFFFALATFYCDANELDLSPEADAGVGPVDFKFSKGKAKVTVEVKLTSNQNLVHGFTEQLPAYSRAERTNRSLLLVVRNGDHGARLRALQKAVSDAASGAAAVPTVVIVDGRKQESASKRRPAQNRGNARRP
jgi:hypothetical protein